MEVKVTYSAQQETDVQTNSVIRQDISASDPTFLDENCHLSLLLKRQLQTGPNTMPKLKFIWMIQMVIATTFGARTKAPVLSSYH